MKMREVAPEVVEAAYTDLRAGNSRNGLKPTKFLD